MISCCTGRALIVFKKDATLVSTLEVESELNACVSATHNAKTIIEIMATLITLYNSYGSLDPVFSFGQLLRLL